MPFELSPIAAKLASVTPRVEKHGDDDVFAVTIGVRITTANTILDRLHPSLRHALYMPVPDQEQLPGVEPSTPLLRTKALGDNIPLTGCFEGWTAAIDHGIDEGDPITLGGAKCDKFRVTVHEGGSVELAFRIGSNDIDAAEAGLLCSHLGQEITLSLTAPAIASDTPAIDGSVAAFEADHPDAGDLFAAQHSGDFGADRDDGPDGNEPDEDGADSEGGETDSGAAEFEAGVRQALGEAGLQPKAPRKSKGAPTLG